MTLLLIALLPIIAGSAATPVRISAVLLLLRGPHGTSTALAFVSGSAVMRLVQGVLLASLFEMWQARLAEADTPSRVVSLVLILAGFALLVGAFVTYRLGSEPPGTPPWWLKLVDAVTPAKAAGLGAAWLLASTRYWVLTLAAVGLIRESGLSQTQQALAYLYFVLGAESLHFLPILASALAPTHSAAVRHAATAWITRYNRPITVAISLLVGTIFLWRGTTGLLA